MRLRIVNRKIIFTLSLIIFGLFALNASWTKAAYITGSESQWINNGNNIYYNLGNVGIGVTNPGFPLDVTGITRSSNGFERAGYGSMLGFSGTSLINNNSIGNGGLGLSSTASQPITFWAGASSFANERMRITSAGNIGIGTTNPLYLLDVNGNIRTGEQTIESANYFKKDYILSFSTGGHRRDIVIPFQTLDWHRAIIKILVTTTDGSVSPYGRIENVHNIIVYNNSGVLGFSSNDVQTNEAFGSLTSLLYIKTPEISGTDVLIPLVWKVSTSRSVKVTIEAWSTSSDINYIKNLSISNSYDNLDSTSVVQAVNLLGNVGIGATNPGVKLDVAGAFRNSGATTHSLLGGSGNVVVMADNTGTLYTGVTAGNWWTKGGDALTNDGTWLGSNNNFDLPIRTNNIERMRITKAGNVGIGTTIPTTSLQVSKDNSIFALGVRSPAYGNGYVTGIVFNVEPEWVPNASYWKSAIYHRREDGTGGNYGRGSLNFAVDSNNDAASVGLEDTKMTILSSGNIGIGTTTPIYRLEVIQGTGASSVIPGINIATNISAGTQRATLGFGLNSALTTGWAIGQSIANNTIKDFYFYDASTASYRMVISANGNVGVGTTNPSGAKLDIESTDAVFNALEMGGNSQTSYTNVLLRSNSGVAQLWKAGTGYSSWGGVGAFNIYNSAGQIAFHPNGIANVLYLASTGNVGIGITNPGRKLDIGAGGTFRNDGATTHSLLGGSGNRFVMADNTGTLYTSSIDGGMLPNGILGSTLYHNGSIWIASTTPIFNNGTNVGIGTTNPGAFRLNVSGDSMFSDAIQHTANVYTKWEDVYMTNDSVRYLQFNQDVAPAGSSTGYGSQIKITFYIISLGESQGGELEVFYQLYWYNGSWAVNNMQVQNAFGSLANLIRLGTAEVNGTKMRIPIYGGNGFGSGRGYKVKMEIIAQNPTAMNFFKDYSVTSSSAASFPGPSYNQVSSRLGIGLGNNVMPVAPLQVTGNALFSGNVGVGVTNPIVKLDIAGNVAFRAASEAGQASRGVEFTPTTWDSGVHIIRSWSAGGGLLLDSANTGTSNAGSEIQLYSSSSGSGDIVFRGTDYGTAQQDRMIIKGNTGNVGIGITNPGRKLDIGAGGTFRNDGATTHSLLGNSGNVLVMADNTGTLYGAATSTLSGTSLLPTGTSGQTLRHDGSVWISNSNLFNNGTNVGIGTTNPTAKLYVNGSASIGAGNYYGRIYSWNPGSYYSDAPNAIISNVDSATTTATSYPQLIIHNNEGTIGNFAGIGFSAKESNSGGNQVIGAAIMTQFVNKVSGGWNSGDLHFITKNLGTMNDAMVIRYNGNVGIGTTNPTNKLHIKATGLTYGTNGVRIEQSADSSYWDFAAMYDAFYFGRNGSTKMQVTADGSMSLGGSYPNPTGITFRTAGDSYFMGGNVGIGTTNPSALLDVRGGHLYVGSETFANPGSWASTINLDGSSHARILIEERSTGVQTALWAHTGGNAKVGTVSSHNFGIITGGTERVTINTVGNVGIGVTNPEYKLDLGVLSAEFSTDRMRFNSYNGPAGGVSGYGGISAGGTAQGTGIIWKPNYASYTKRSAGILQIAEGNYFRAGLAFYTNNVTDPTTDWSEAMRISSPGNVGIGATNPGVKLDVAGAFRNSGATTHSLLGGSGNVVVMADNTGTLYTGVTAGNWWTKGGDALANDSTWLGSTNNFDLPIITNNAERMRITKGGNVGIGTTLPTVKLQVNRDNSIEGLGIRSNSYGNGFVTGIVFNVEPNALPNGNYWKSAIYHKREDGASGNYGRGSLNFAVDSNNDPATITTADTKMTILSNGNVGIGLTNPVSKLEVISGFSSSDSNSVVKARWVGGTMINDSTGVYPAVLGEATAAGWYAGNFVIGVHGLAGRTARIGSTNSIGIRGHAFYAENNSYTGLSYEGNLYGGYFSTETSWVSGDKHANNAFGLYVRPAIINSGSFLNHAYGLYIDSVTNSGTLAGNQFGVYQVSNLMSNYFAGNVGIGLTNPGTKLDISGNFRNSLATTHSSLGGSGNVFVMADNTGTLYTGTATGAFLPLAGGTMSGHINMGGNDISNIGTISGNKLEVAVIDPLYSIDGVTYSTYAASFAGGLKEEYVDRIRITRSVGVGVSREFEAVLNFDQAETGSDLWLWRQVVDFSPENVEALVTPYGQYAQVYYIIKDNQIIFRSDRPVEISYRLIGRRFDWRQWPTLAPDQSRPGYKVR